MSNSKKIRMNFGVVKTIILALVIGACLAVVAVDIVLLVGTDNIKTASPAVAAVSLVAATLIIVAASLVLLNSNYRFCDVLKITLGFFVDKVQYDKIVSILENSVTKELTLIIQNEKNGKGEDLPLRLNLSRSASDDFISALKDKRGDIIVEVFTPEEKKK